MDLEINAWYIFFSVACNTLACKIGWGGGGGVAVIFQEKKTFFV